LHITTCVNFAQWFLFPYLLQKFKIWSRVAKLSGGYCTSFFVMLLSLCSSLSTPFLEYYELWCFFWFRLSWSKRQSPSNLLRVYYNSNRSKNRKNEKAPTSQDLIEAVDRTHSSRYHIPIFFVSVVSLALVVISSWWSWSQVCVYISYNLRFPII
jgi:hypothetical protein